MVCHPIHPVDIVRGTKGANYAIAKEEKFETKAIPTRQAWYSRPMSMWNVVSIWRVAVVAAGDERAGGAGARGGQAARAGARAARARAAARGARAARRPPPAQQVSASA